MAQKILSNKNFYGGISDAEKVGVTGSFFFGQKLNIFQDPQSITILPQASKVSGSTVLGLVKWIVPGTPHDDNTYFYDNGGRIYRETSADVWSLLTTISNSNGQGLAVFDDRLYYAQDSQLGRTSSLAAGSLTFDDDYQIGMNGTSATKFSPLKPFLDFLAVGHGNEVHKIFGTETSGADIGTADLTLPPGFQVRAMEILDEFLVIAAWRSKTTAITETEEGYLFFWDGTSSTFNFSVKLEDGVPLAILNTRNRLMSVIGSSGFIYLNHAPLQKVQQIPKMVLGKTVGVAPAAMTNWRGNAFIGVPAIGTSTDIVRGVYQWGSRSDRYPESLNFAFPISTGTTGAGVVIGAIQGLGNKLYIGWEDNNTFGVDAVTITNDPYTTGTYESLIFDDNRPADQKLALVVKAYHSALRSGESIQLGYKTNRATSYTTGTANSTVGSTETRLPVPAADARFNEFQFECILTASGANAPTVFSVALLYDDLIEEEQF